MGAANAGEPATDNLQRWSNKPRNLLKEEAVWLWIAAAVCTVAAWLALRRDWPAWPGIGLLVVAALSLFISAFRLPDKGREWLIEHGVLALGIGLSIVLGLALVLWVWVNLSWASDAHLVVGQQMPIGATNSPLSLTATYPKVALLDAGDSALLLTLARTDGQPLARQTLTVTIAPDSGLTFPDALTVDSRQFLIELGPGRPATERIPLVNDGSFRGFRARQVQIAVTSPGSSGTLKLGVTVEGRRGLALRRFVNSTVDQASPLILLLVLALPALAALGQKVVDERFAALKERRRKAFDDLTEQFRRQLRVGGVDGAEAEKTLENMKEHAHAKQATDVTDLGRKLLALTRLEAAPAAAGTPDLMDAISAGRRWPEELAAAFLNADRKVDDLGVTATPGVTQAEVDAKANFLRQAADELLNNPLLLNDKNLQDKLDAALLKLTTRSSLLAVAPPPVAGQPRVLSGVFLNRRAEHGEEMEFLFPDGDDGAFMSQSDWNRQLGIIRRSVIYRGQPGCGRTTLALAVERRRDLFARNLQPVLLKGQLSPDDVVRLALEALLTQIGRRPTCLDQLSAGQRHLLAGLLLSTLSYSRSLFVLEEAQKQVLRPTDPEQPDARAIALPLQRLKRALQERAATESPAASSGVRWNEVARTIGDFRQVLDLPRLLFIYDAPSDGDDGLRHLWPQVQTWQAAGARFLLFVPQTTHYLPDNFEDRSLVWTRDSLEKLIDHRCRAYGKQIGFEPPFASWDWLHMHFVDDGSLELLLDACQFAGDHKAYSPQRLRELWLAAAGTNRIYGEQMDKADVERAMLEVKRGA